MFYGPPFPLLVGAGSHQPCPEAPESSTSRSLSLSDESAVTSQETAQSVRRVAGQACSPGVARGPWACVKLGDTLTTGSEQLQ